jgi:hypothetical protein
MPVAGPESTTEAAPTDPGVQRAPELKPRLGEARLWALPSDTSAATSTRPTSPLQDRTIRRPATPSDPWAFSTWTKTDAAGLRWGAGPGVLYVGGIVVPTCAGRFDASNCGFGVSPAQRGEYGAWLHLQIGLADQRRWFQIRERGQAIRYRRNAERDSASAPKR